MPRMKSLPNESNAKNPVDKIWLVPRFRRGMGSFQKHPARLVEPFAGGGIISLTAAFEMLADSVVILELDSQIAAVWHTIFGGDSKWLAKRILNFELSPESARRELAKIPKSLAEQAFQPFSRIESLKGGFWRKAPVFSKTGRMAKGFFPAGTRKPLPVALQTLMSWQTGLNSFMEMLLM